MIWILKSCSMDLKQLLKENSEHCFLSVGFDEFFILAGEIPLKSVRFSLLLFQEPQAVQAPKAVDTELPSESEDSKRG